MRTLSLPLLLVLATPALAGEDPFAFFADGVQSVQIEGDGQVPLLRGVDTDTQPAVLARGQKEEDEFLLHVSMLSGVNLCTEAVAKALDGEIEEYTLGKSKKGGPFSSTIKQVTKGASIPEVTLEGESGKIVLRDWHCEIHATDNVLAIPTLSEVAVARHTDKGAFEFMSSAMGDELLAKVGTPVQAQRVTGSAFFFEGKLQTKLGGTLVFDGSLFGQPAKLALVNEGPPRISGPIVEPPLTAQYGGHMSAIGAAAIGDVTLTERGAFHVWDQVVLVGWAEDPEDDLEVDAIVSSGLYADVSIAVDPLTDKVAFKKVEAGAWTDPTDKFLEDAKKTFDKATASLLTPAIPDTRLASVDTAAFCDPVVMTDTSYQSVNGVRMFGAAAQAVGPNQACPDGVMRAEEEAAEGDAGSPDESDSSDSGSSEAGTDKKEAKRLADYADALWKHGRYDEALDLYDQARGLAGEDCSYHQDFAGKALLMGRTDVAIAAAQRSAELYEPWAAQDIEVRIAVQNKDNVPEGTITTPQSHDCHVARGIQANGLLAKGSHKRIEELHDAHMDLDENLALALAVSRLQRGQSKRARGPAVQALNVGARGGAAGHLVHGVVASQWGSERLLQANLDRLLSLNAELGAGDYLVGVAMARRSTEPDAVERFVEQAITRRPSDAGAWAAYAIEARRRGDTGALAKARTVAAEVARDEVDVTGGLGRGWCRGAALLYAVGETAAGDTYLKTGRAQPKAEEQCLVASIVKQVASGDAQATANALHELAVRQPTHPLGTLELVSALPSDETD